MYIEVEAHRKPCLSNQRTIRTIILGVGLERTFRGAQEKYTYDVEVVQRMGVPLQLEIEMNVLTDH